jgi:hypothetical protein
VQRSGIGDQLEHDQLIETFDLLVSGGSTPEAAATRLRLIAPDRAEEVDAIWANFEVRAGIIRYADDPAALVARTSVGPAWYTGPKPSDRFWPAVRGRLSETLSDAAIESIDIASSKVLSLLHAPGEASFGTRGLVLGNVQSGKTTSFISVLSKAADRGFRVFIVLSGITDNLRSQTQERVDEILLGPDGDGWYRLTREDTDFNESPANAAAVLSAGLKLIAVVKKNPARLRRLRNWLNAAGATEMARAPMVLIDDEADQASIDVGKNRTSVINGLLREVLARPKAAYVAYTATPFANLLIDPQDHDDLYPRHFVVALPRSADYFGAERIFGRLERLSDEDEPDDGLDVVRSIDPAEADNARPPGRSISTWEPTVGPGLEAAIRWFLLASAARRLRGGGNKHSTMLVHTSMLATAHERMAEAIESYLETMAEMLVMRSPDELESLRALYLSESAKVPAEQFSRAPVDVDAVLNSLSDVILDLRVIVDNYRSADRLVYPKDTSSTTIVVGGNTLSRGLTLEGLCSSYFVRSASTYDTLLQMGRWFGYRSGYEDLCRIWMTDDLAGWFRDLSLVEAEIRNEILRYEFEGVTPDEIGVRIRTHPAMAITAAIKSRDAVAAQMTFSGGRPQTILFKRTDRSWLTHNIDAVRRLSGALGRLYPEIEVRNRLTYLGVPADEILKFVDDYRFHEHSRSIKSDLLRSYIKSELRVGALETWNVVFMAPPSDDGIDLGLSRRVSLMSRSRLATVDDETANMKAIVSTPDRISDVSIDDQEFFLGGGRVPDTDLGLRILRDQVHPRQGLLCIYPISANSKARASAERKGLPRIDLAADADVIGIALFFPAAENGQSLVEYVTANVSETTYETLDEESAQIDSADNLDELQAESAGVTIGNVVGK